MKTKMMAGPGWQDKYDSLQKVGPRKAREIGQKYYWPNAACPEGHVWWRHTQNNDCVFCQRRRGQESRLRKSRKERKMLKIDSMRDDIALKKQLEDMEL